MMTRRTFIRQTAMAAGLAGLAGPFALELHANPLKMPIGFQSWVVRELLAKDFAGTLKQMAGLGFQTVEMCSPPDYLSSGFGPLAGLKAPEMRRIIRDAGLRCESCHFPFQGLKDNLHDRIASGSRMTRRSPIGAVPATKPIRSANRPGKRGCRSFFTTTISNSSPWTAL
jgi:hypothetical protein